MRRFQVLAALAIVGCDAVSMLADASAHDAPAHDAPAIDGSELDAAIDGFVPIPPCTDPPGSACNPILIDALPFAHAADTRTAEARLDAYACAPAIAESGGELHYELRLSDPLRAVFTLEEARGVDVDVHVLRGADPSSCIARANTTLEQPLGAGSWRVIVDTFGTGSGGAYTLRVEASEPAPRSLGTLWNTYYFVADEAEHTGPQDTPIYDSACNELARVREGFHDSVCIEGSGRLADGTMINYASTCTTSCPAARTCGGRSYRVCYTALDPALYPWGMGAGGRALEVDRSMAVDRALIPLGSIVYLEELDGLVRPGTGEPHDGCMRADDVGGAIVGDHFDFFSGTRARWLAWEALLPTRSTLHGWIDDPRCYPRP